MRRIGQLGLLFFISGLAAPADAALLLYEGFDYTVGTPLLGKVNPSNGLTYLQAGPTGRVNTINIASGNLATPQVLPAPTGNSANINGIGSAGSNGTADRIGLGGAITPTPTGNAVYYSLALRVDSLSGSNNTTGGFGIGLNTSVGAQGTTPGTVAAKLQMRIDPTDATKFNLGIFTNRNATAASLSWSALKLDVGTTYFIVASHVMNSTATNNDFSHLWINPATLTLGAPIAPAPTVSDTTPGNETNMNQVASILIRQSPAPFMTIDELRVGNTWADVTPVPEPGSLAMLVLAGVACGVRSRWVRQS